MRHLIDDFISHRISRRGFLTGMMAAGYTLASAKSALAAVSPFAGESAAESAVYRRSVTGVGGDLVADQLLEVGVRCIFAANSSGGGPLADALVTRPQLQMFQAVQEGQVVSMADGYSRVSGIMGVGWVSRIGVGHAVSNMHNAKTDRSPVLLLSDHSNSTSLGPGQRDPGWIDAFKPYTNFSYLVTQAERIPEWVRQACKLSTVFPSGPTHIRIPRDLMYQENVRSTIFSGEAFNRVMEIRPDPALVERAARQLLDARTPVLHVGPEVTQCGARAAMVEFAELMGMPVVQSRSYYADFPTFHPLHVHQAHGGGRVQYPNLSEVDCVVSFGASGSRGMRGGNGQTVVHTSLDPDELHGQRAGYTGLLGHSRQTAEDLMEAVKSLATPQRLRALTEERRSACEHFTAQRREAMLAAARRSTGSPVPWPRLMVELNDRLERDAIVVPELGSTAKVSNYFSFGDGEKLQVGRSLGGALGWGVGASVGAKIAAPDRQVVAIQGDGSFLFGQTDSLWTMARFEVPILLVILNNQSYEEPRLSILGHGGASGQAGRDYLCYLGDPDIDFTKLASAYGISGAVVRNTDELSGAIRQGLRTLRDGKPFVLDVHVQRIGVGAETRWYPNFSVARQRERLA